MQDRHIPVPYTSRLLSEIAPGQTLNVHGNVHADATRFEINLLSNCTEIDPHMGSVPLHFGFRFDEGKIVLNSFAVCCFGHFEFNFWLFRLESGEKKNDIPTHSQKANLLIFALE